MGDEVIIDSTVGSVGLELYEWSDVLLDGGWCILLNVWIFKLRLAFIFSK